MSEKTKVLQGQKFLKDSYPDFRPRLLMVLGSGLGSMTGVLNPVHSINYSEIPGFPRSTIKGHTGRLMLCRLGKSEVAVLSGRVHLYEGYTAQEVVRPLRIISLWGAETVFLTNAAGSLNPLFEPGTIMGITDQINLTGENPLCGENIDEWGPRFPDMSRLYCQDLLTSARKTAVKMGFHLHQGVYMGIKGPCLETRAETRAFRKLGADSIGMSTVLESIAAAHMGKSILGLSCLTNHNLPDCMQVTSHEEILQVADRTNRQLTLFLKELALESCGV
ncbi:purine-nucleoside phosphorylase [Desulfonatronovibrio magnus]|uniref:purine-nucleoside phosphorylase n=1 Tax=Desulfonatronovibrio magnus TaxID=698827 RepID=UPI0005EB6730|nr:purine-nucleoside phosphorylase [Desulfonatronovibrio magnus]